MKPITFLIVEDDENHAELTVRAIRKSNNQNGIDVVTTGEDALDYLYARGEFEDRATAEKPGLILLDINLPGLSGLDVLKRIKDDDELRRIPVIILTTSDNPKDKEAAYKLHVNSFLTKPVGHKDFMKKIADFKYYWIMVNEMPGAY